MEDKRLNNVDLIQAIVYLIAQNIGVHVAPFTYRVNLQFSSYIVHASYVISNGELIGHETKCILAYNLIRMLNDEHARQLVTMNPII